MDPEEQAVRDETPVKMRNGDDVGEIAVDVLDAVSDDMVSAEQGYTEESKM